MGNLGGLEIVIIGLFVLVVIGAIVAATIATKKH
ncbi:hypothetical protein KIPE111705_07485 [Kibdelosporangium persicum]